MIKLGWLQAAAALGHAESQYKHGVFLQSLVFPAVKKYTIVSAPAIAWTSIIDGVECVHQVAHDAFEQAFEFFEHVDFLATPQSQAREFAFEESLRRSRFDMNEDWRQRERIHRIHCPDFKQNWPWLGWNLCTRKECDPMRPGFTITAARITQFYGLMKTFQFKLAAGKGPCFAGPEFFVRTDDDGVHEAVIGLARCVPKEYIKLHKPGVVIPLNEEGRQRLQAALDMFRQAADQGIIEAMLEAVRLCRLYDLEGATKLKIYAVEFYGPKFYSLPGVTIWPEDRFLRSEIARFFSSDYDIFQFDFIVLTAAE
jgi:hypothetical protein